MKPTALFLLDQDHWENVYGPEERRDLEKLVQAPLCFHTRESIRKEPEQLAEAEVIFSGWGMEKCDAAFLARAPKLKAVFYGAGSVRGIVTDAFWDRGIRMSTSNAALAIPVAEFTLGQILLSLKAMWRQALDVRRAKAFVHHPFPGIYESTVGLISIGTISRHLISLLSAFRLKIIAYDPFLSPAEAEKLGIELCPLEDVFARADVVSLHTPWLPETERMIRGHHFDRMRSGSTFINTARGAIIDEAELIEVFTRRPDLFALLDVTHPEPPSPDSPLYQLPNVWLTPHIAGAMGHECRRMGRMAVEECERYLQGKPLLGEVTREKMASIA